VSENLFHSIYVSPSGHPTPDTPWLETAWGKALRRSIPEGLWALTNEKAQGDSTFEFWRSIATRFLSILAERQNLENESERCEVLIENSELEDVLSRRPPCVGSEYLSIESLAGIWAEMNKRLRAQLRERDCTPAGWLETFGSHWSSLGRVCLHLAENRRSESHPFAFLATIALSVSNEGRVLYTPLGRAFSEAETKSQKKRLGWFMKPLDEAAKSLPWLATAISSGDVFGAQTWTPQQAHDFLKSLATLDSFGVRARIPDWWKSGNQQVKVKVVVDAVAGSRLGADGLLQFDFKVALNDEDLTAEEWKALLVSTDPLVRLRGRWVEVDKEKIEQALAHWSKAAAEAKEGGLAWHEGMRLLAGLGKKQGLLSAPGADVPELTKDWTSYVAGPRLSDTLATLRKPDLAADVCSHGKDLHATLRPYQERGVAWLALLTDLGLGACLADDMGLGKTIQVITLLLYRQRQSCGHFRTLLVAPASLLANWRDECAKFSPTLRVHVDHAAFALQNDVEFDAADLVVTTYGALLRSERLGARSWDLLVLDEAQAIKNPQASQTRAVKSLRSRARIALTGTPVENRLMDLWSLFDFLNPGLLSNQQEFKRFVNPGSGEMLRLGQLRGLTQPYILRRLKTDRSVIQDLPDKTEMRVWCALSKTQAALYEGTVREFARALKVSKGTTRRGIVLSFLMRFKQICNHPDQAQGGAEFDPRASGKFVRLREIVETIVERQEKLLVFSQYREMCPVLAKWLTPLFGRPGLVLDGQTAVAKRRELVTQFQAENGPPFFILSLKAGGTGLTLTAANHVIHFDRWWNPAVENQATDRAFRIGQHRGVLVHKFICRGTLEERIDEMIEAKKSLAEGVLGADGAELPLTELSDAELLKLVSIDLTAVASDAEGVT